MISFISEHAALIDIKPDQVIDTAKAEIIFDYTDEFLDGDYGVICDRHHGHCFNIKDVFPLIHHHKRLRIIAMVVHDDDDLEIVRQESEEFDGDMGIFRSIVEATDWINTKFT